MDSRGETSSSVFYLCDYKLVSNPAVLEAENGGLEGKVSRTAPTALNENEDLSVRVESPIVGLPTPFSAPQINEQQRPTARNPSRMPTPTHTLQSLSFMFAGPYFPSVNKGQ